MLGILNIGMASAELNDNLVVTSSLVFSHIQLLIKGCINQYLSLGS